MKIPAGGGMGLGLHWESAASLPSSLFAFVCPVLLAHRSDEADVGLAAVISELGCHGHAGTSKVGPSTVNACSELCVLRD